MDNEYKRGRNRTVLDLMSIDELRHEINARIFGEKDAEIDELANFIDMWKGYYPTDVMEAANILINKHRKR